MGLLLLLLLLPELSSSLSHCTEMCRIPPLASVCQMRLCWRVDDDARVPEVDKVRRLPAFV